MSLINTHLVPRFISQLDDRREEEDQRQGLRGTKGFQQERGSSEQDSREGISSKLWQALQCHVGEDRPATFAGQRQRNIIPRMERGEKAAPKYSQAILPMEELETTLLDILKKKGPEDLL